MARITVEDCLEKVTNRFELVIAGARRAKQLLKGAPPLVESDNKEVVTALREIAAGEVTAGYPAREQPAPSPPECYGKAALPKPAHHPVVSDREEV